MMQRRWRNAWRKDGFSFTVSLRALINPSSASFAQAGMSPQRTSDKRRLPSGLAEDGDRLSRGDVKTGRQFRSFLQAEELEEKIQGDIDDEAAAHVFENT